MCPTETVPEGYADNSDDCWDGDKRHWAIQREYVDGELVVADTDPPNVDCEDFIQDPDTGVNKFGEYDGCHDADSTDHHIESLALPRNHMQSCLYGFALHFVPNFCLLV